MRKTLITVEIEFEGGDQEAVKAIHVSDGRVTVTESIESWQEVAEKVQLATKMFCEYRQRSWG